MGMTVLQIVQEFTTRTGIGSPIVAVGNSNPQILQIVSLLNEELEEVFTRTDLQLATREKVFQTLAAEDQGALTTLIGADFESFVSDTLWDRDERLEIYGPHSAQSWQAQKALQNASPRYTFRVRGGHLFLFPAPSAGKNIACEYRSRYGVLDGNGTTLKERIASDADTFIFTDAQMLAALRWRWKREKGLTYAEDKARYESILSSKSVRDKAMSTLSLEGRPREAEPHILIPQGYWNVP